MEQKDYLLREIEKIALVIAAIWQKLFGGKENLAITLTQQMDEAKEMLLSGINFDLDYFLTLNEEESTNYINSFKGFTIENIENLATLIAQIGFSDTSQNAKKYLEKALQLYEFCNTNDKTYSLERETRVKEIKEIT
jgi:hypothetical protein